MKLPRRFPLWACLLLLAVLSIPCSIVSNRVRYYRRQQALEQSLYAAGVLPYRTVLGTDSVTQWMIGEPAFTIDGFRVLALSDEEADGELAAVAAALGVSRIKAVDIDGSGQGLGGGPVVTCGPPGRLGRVGVKALQAMRVCDLQLINIEMSEQAWSGLGRLKALESLSLPGGLREEHLVSLAQLDSLRTLRIPRSFVKAARLETILPGVEIVVVGPDLDPTIAWYLQSIRAGKSNQFGMYGPLTRDQEADLLYAFSQLDHDDLAAIELTGCRLDGDTVTSMKRFHALKSLDLSNSNATSALLSELLPHLPSLEELTLSNCEMDDSLLPVLLKLESLRTLWIDGTKMTKEAVDVLFEQKPELLLIE